MSRKSRSRSRSAAGDPRFGSGPAEAAPLVCPVCEARYAPDQRFCARCDMPLVVGDDPEAAEGPAGELHDRARKIRPELARGELVRVASGRNQAEAELIHGFLLEEGIPSLVRRSAAFDVPDFLAAGQRDVLVPRSGAEHARELLHGAELEAAGADEDDESAADPAAPSSRHAVLLVTAILGGGAVTALVAWVLTQLAG